MVPLARTAISQASSNSKGSTAGTSQVVIQTLAALGWGGTTSSAAQAAAAWPGAAAVSGAPRTRGSRVEEDMAKIPKTGKKHDQTSASAAAITATALLRVTAGSSRSR